MTKAINFQTNNTDEQEKNSFAEDVIVSLITFWPNIKLAEKQMTLASCLSWYFHSLTRFGMLTACDYEKFPETKNIFDMILYYTIVTYAQQYEVEICILFRENAVQLRQQKKNRRFRDRTTQMIY